MSPDDVVEAMARGIHNANPGLHETWAQIVAAEALGNRLAVRTATLRRNEARAALRALPPGWVVTKVPEATSPETVPWRYGDAWEGVQEGADEETLAPSATGMQTATTPPSPPCAPTHWWCAMSERATCGTCRWWEPEQADDPEASGTCRRYAPRPRVFDDHGYDPAYPIWPRTLWTEWCGEHQPREVGDE